MKQDPTRRVSIATAVLLAISLLGASERARASLGELPENPGNLGLFGYSVNTEDKDIFAQYLRETAKFSATGSSPRRRPMSSTT